MDGDFTILGTEPGVERISPTRLRDVRIVTAVADTSGVQYSFRVVPGDFSKTHVDLIAHDLALAFDTLASKPGVIGIRVEQDTNPADSFYSNVIVTVESPSGQSEGDVRLSWGDAQGPVGYKKVAAERALLASIEGG